MGQARPDTAEERGDDVADTRRSTPRGGGTKGDLAGGSQQQRERRTAEDAPASSHGRALPAQTCLRENEFDDSERREAFLTGATRRKTVQRNSDAGGCVREGKDRKSEGKSQTSLIPGGAFGPARHRSPDKVKRWRGAPVSPVRDSRATRSSHTEARSEEGPRSCLYSRKPRFFVGTKELLQPCPGRGSCLKL